MVGDRLRLSAYQASNLAAALAEAGCHVAELAAADDQSTVPMT